MSYVREWMARNSRKKAVHNLVDAAKEEKRQREYDKWLEEQREKERKRQAWLLTPEGRRYQRQQQRQRELERLIDERAKKMIKKQKDRDKWEDQYGGAPGSGLGGYY